MRSLCPRALFVKVAKNATVRRFATEAAKVEDSVWSWNVKLSEYGRSGRVSDAKRTFDRMEQRTVVSWNALITAFGRHGKCVEAAKSLFDRMPRWSGISWTVMIAAYGLRGQVEDSRKLLRTIPEPTFDAWGATIAACAQNDQKELAFELLKLMDLEGMKPSQSTLSIVLSACAKAGALRDGKLVHQSFLLAGEAPLDVVLGNALVHMYGKCGCLELAKNVFAELETPNTISWSSLVAAYARGSKGSSALENFWKMRLEGNDLDQIAFTNILSACSHGGLLRHGWTFFNSMVEDHCIAPTLEHFSCLIDLLGRIGQVDAAEDLLKSMPTKADAASWRCLLGACRSHNEVGIGTHAHGHASTIDSGDSSAYGLLSSIHRAGTSFH
ncbi:hypothetical protein SELMODRAFT_92456 [Selaginella moellendorffii]|uniref:Pentacotripeptide-repeat region of PRORP domain-containing protein n=1 Tax=Selaginella moellendorffii TaxID=88036 RepID=D8RFN6_SELML|nr:pentatricopeptide repeat-containing protein At4g02750 [Selaginella moellendorffii]XP_024530742.1 pentatricopeptide repeat-containing protein At4g02750 [Selaginella moellendorffii]XP_024530744.1 pentatricopeptide repeat-containing protein At4g02750 [Selaginella moellendorffii]EFJ29152.1 hypothetical protein SELMODRAFT_92456 [Selaginella moellendorffii]|eukprot:XP_002970028.1 pentatricopeptide repeat-containing protein At4g02750 [Selaginella moellendorffii]